MKTNKIKISKVLEDSIAEEIGLEIGDTIISINDTKFYDILEYQYLSYDENIVLLVEKGNGEEYQYEIEKDFGEDLGIEFENSLIDIERSCHNKCIFCFIDQLPKGMRKTLYYKDDDYRLSFLQGNYVTLTNVAEDEIDRMIKYRISPINISVHTTDPELRIKMLNNKNANKIISYMRKLADGGINFNCQIVLCPDVNDKENLDKTIEDLSRFYPSLNSVSIVPVGLTKFRQDLFPLRAFDKQEAINVINQIEKWQNKFREQFGTSLIFAADEFFILAEKRIPECDYYEDFPQIENGVGLISLFKDQFYEYFNSIDKEDFKLNTIRTVSIATGYSAYKYLRELCNNLEDKFDNLKINLFKIRNDFFGESITVAGLITGNDIINQIKDKSLGEELLVPECMLRSGETVFLDDVSINDLENKLKIKVTITKVDGQDFINKILGR